MPDQTKVEKLNEKVSQIIQNYNSLKDENKVMRTELVTLKAENEVQNAEIEKLIEENVMKDLEIEEVVEKIESILG